MQLVHRGKSDEEAVENAIKTLELGRKKLAVSRHDVYVSSVHYCKKGCFSFVIKVIIRQKIP